MNISINGLTPFVSLVFGVLVLLFPKIVNYLIAAYLIVNGLIGLGLLK
ncbi:MAG: DUF3096 domain-containing protein [Candidatus Shapirobacteria bacterium]